MLGCPLIFLAVLRGLRLRRSGKEGDGYCCQPRLRPRLASRSAAVRRLPWLLTPAVRLRFQRHPCRLILALRSALRRFRESQKGKDGFAIPSGDLVSAGPPK